MYMSLKMVCQTIEYEHAGIIYRDSVIHPELSNMAAPVVLVIPDYHGATPYALAEAQWLSTLGFIGFCVDIYGDSAMPRSSADAAQQIIPLFDNRERTLSRTQAALQQACCLDGADSTRLGVIGFSSGGLFALDMARRMKKIKAAASIWGVALPWELKPSPMCAPNVDGASLLLIHGTNDIFNPMESNMSVIRELDDAGCDYQMVLMGGKKHAFSIKHEDNLEILNGEEPQALLYDAVADKRAHYYLKNFLAKTLLC